MSFHSPRSPSSERSDPTVVYDMLPPQRVIERMSSYPSLSHSSTTATSDDPHDFSAAGEVMTPVDTSFMAGNVKVQDEEQELLSPIHEGRRGLRGFSKSMQSLRGKAKSDRERSRSTSRERPPVPIVEPGLKVSAANRPSPPMAIPSNKALAQAPPPSRPKPQRSGSSFSSFIRKLTGKSSKAASPAVPTHQPILAPRDANTVAKRSSPPSPPSRKPTLAIDTGSNPSSGRPGHYRKTSLPLDIVAAVPLKQPIEPAPLSAPPRAPTIVLVDPRTVPLPPSPPSPAVVLLDEEAMDFSLSPTSYKRATSASLSSQKSREIPEVEEEHESSDEAEDIVRPLPSAGAQANGRISTSPISATTLNEPDVQTPLSPSFPTNQDRRSLSPAGFGGSPPRNPQAFGGNTYSGRKESVRVRDPPPANLGRKESKWRKSVMNLSETLNGQSKRVSKAPPTSFDAYQQHQQRMANNRRSCAPTLHSTGTVSAEIRQIKDKEQQEMADTFFLS